MSCHFLGIQRYSRSQRTLNALLSSCDFTLNTEGSHQRIEAWWGVVECVLIKFVFLEEGSVAKDGDRMLGEEEGAGKLGER